MSKRFDVVATNKELVLVPEKTAIRIELQYGKDGEPTELVVAEMYWKDNSAWAYTRSQVRLDCTLDNAKYVLDSTKAMYESSKKVVKAASSKPSIETAIDSMTEDEKHALLELLLSKAKTDTKTTPKKPTTKTEDKPSDAELVLENFMASRRTGTNKRK